LLVVRLGRRHDLALRNVRKEVGDTFAIIQIEAKIGIGLLVDSA
jgi:hypothetical protein